MLEDQRYTLILKGNDGDEGSLNEIVWSGVLSVLFISVCNSDHGRAVPTSFRCYQLSLIHKQPDKFDVWFFEANSDLWLHFCLVSQSWWRPICLRFYITSTILIFNCIYMSCGNYIWRSGHLKPTWGENPVHPHFYVLSFYSSEWINAGTRVCSVQIYFSIGFQL